MEEKDYGQIKISEDVIGTIANLAALEITGVSQMHGGLTGNITEMLGKKSFTKGVRVELEEEKVTIDLYLFIDYGVVIPDVSWKIQENVKSTVENMTGLNVELVNVHIEGITFQKEEE
ncbi:MAG: Asp23/Gls24 family envelope stress response protein [Peptostreptococcaceae bacterium]|jgi:uncharacterized alkaline shock family protein YloU|nr:Asp23/Gls24 family envelope stress response protein [Peptostreptococcaceae bacterium]